MYKCIIFDIDGTVANLSHRVHHVNGKHKDWVAFMATLSDDKPIDQTIWLHNLIADHSNIPIFFCSGRSEDERYETERWLNLHGMFQGVTYKRLLMRPAKDYRADTIIKRELLGEIRGMGFEPWLIFDDRPQVVDMWREEGLFVLQADPKPAYTEHDAYLFSKHIKYPLTVTVGPAGAGKSTWVSNNATPGSVISSDQIRQDLCGDFRDQSRNLEVFDIMHELAAYRLKRALPVTIDSTNLRNKDRIAVAKLVPESVAVNYVVINRPVVEKEVTAGWRKGVNVKGLSLVQYHENIFASNLKDILKGDNLPNVTVTNLIGK